MCGVPFHQLETYLRKAITAGFRVAVCEQTETPEAAKERSKSGAGGSAHHPRQRPLHHHPRHLQLTGA